MREARELRQRAEAVRVPLVRPTSNMSLGERIAERFYGLVAQAGDSVAHCNGLDCAADSTGTCACGCVRCSRRRVLHERVQHEIAGPPPEAGGLPASPRVGALLPPPPPRRRAVLGEKPPRATTLMSMGVVEGPRARHDPRREPENCVEVTGPHRRR